MLTMLNIETDVVLLYPGCDNATKISGKKKMMDIFEKEFLENRGAKKINLQLFQDTTYILDSKETVEEIKDTWEKMKEAINA